MIRASRTLLLLLAVTAFAPSAPASEPASGQAAIVQSMEEQTGRLVDALIARDRAAAGQQYDLLKSSLDRLHSLASQKDFSERRSREVFTAYSWMRLIAIDMRQQAWTGAAIAANQMSGEIIRFTDFSTLTLRDVAWMGYLSRDVMLLSMEDMQGNMQAIELRRGELGETWKRVREELIKDFRNKTLVMRGDQMIEGIQQAKDGSVLIGRCVDAHKFVDEIDRSIDAGHGHS